MARRRLHIGKARQKAARLSPIGVCAAVLGLGLTVGAASAGADPAVQVAGKSDDLRQEIRDLQVSFTGLARRLRNHEAALASAEQTLATLEAEEAAKLEALGRQRLEHFRTLAALQRIAVQPKAAMALTGDDPVDALRGALLLKAALPAIEERAAHLRQVLEELSELRHSIEDERRTLAAAAAALKARRQEVSALIGRKKGLLAISEEEQKRAAAKSAKLAKQAESLRDLMALTARQGTDDRRDGEDGDTSASAAETAGEDRQEAIEPGPERHQVASLQRPDTVRAFPEEPGSILMPAHGEIVLRYGEIVPSSSGQDERFKGLKIRTRPGADVIAPFDGKVVFSGNFRSYGRILIIDHGGRYHTLLAGLHRIRAVVGQWVLAGEPVATMDPQDSKAPELYLELRRTGQPVNPLPWLAEGEQRARG